MIGFHALNSGMRPYGAPILLSITVLVWLGIIGFQTGFLGDDLRYLYEIESHHSFAERIDYLVQPLGTAFVWRPLANASWMGEYALFGRSPIGYHISNLVVVALTALLLFFICMRLTTRIIAAWAAALFLLFPNHYEITAWISGRTDGLALFFSLAALALFIAYREKRKKFFFISSLFFYFCGLLVKESAAFTPLLLLLYDIMVARMRTVPAMKAIVAYAGVAAIYLALRVSVLGSLVSTDPTLSAHLASLPTIRETYTFFTRSLSVVNESVLREYAPALARVWSEQRVPLLLLGGVFLLCIHIRNLAKRTFLLPAVFGVSAYILFSLPVLSLAEAITSELKHSRFLYGSSAGLALLGALMLWTHTRGRVLQSVQIAARVAVVGLFGAGLALNAIPWVRAGQVVAKTTEHLAPFQERLTSRPAPILLVHRVPGEVQGAYAFHDPFSFSQSARMRFSAMTADIYSVGSAHLTRSPFCEDERETPVLLLEWRGGQFVEREEDVRRWLASHDQVTIGHFTTYQEFLTSGWSLHDLKVENAHGAPMFIRTGNDARLELALLQSLPSQSFRTVNVLFSDQEPQQITIAWSSPGSDTFHPLNSIRSKPATHHRLELCRYPNWAISDSISRIQVRLPKTFQKGVISEISFGS